MREYKGVRGTMESVPSIEVNVDTVYVRSNVVRIEEENFLGWEYDEAQYDVKEYIELISKESKELRQATEEYLIDLDFRLSVSEMGM